ncbi:MAG: response regulator [Solirubrobacterales bacterium]
MRDRVLIVDDHAGFRASARRVLEHDGYEIVGEAEDGRAAIEAVASLRPEIVLLDVQLPDLDGFEVARRIAEARDTSADTPEPARPSVVLTSTRRGPEIDSLAATCGASGFVPKEELSGATLAAQLG